MITKENETFVMDELSVEVMKGIRNKDGVYDLERLQLILKQLNEQKKAIREQEKKAEKEKKTAENDKLAIRGKAYYNSLSVGDEFYYVSASGEEFAAKKISTKSKTNSSAACELINPPTNAKTAKRYPKFFQVQVPAEFNSEEVA